MRYVSSRCSSPLILSHFLPSPQSTGNVQQRHPVPPRRSATVDAHRAGHSINHHPEDVPYITAQKQRYPDNPLDLADGLDYPDERTRIPTSARRYYDTRGNRVIEQGNRRLVIHDES